MQDKGGLPWKERIGEGESNTAVPGCPEWRVCEDLCLPGRAECTVGEKKPCLLWDYSQDKALCVCADIVSKVRGKKITFKWEEQKEPPKTTRDRIFFSSKKRVGERFRSQSEQALSLTGTFQHWALRTKKELLQPFFTGWFYWLNVVGMNNP